MSLALSEKVACVLKRAVVVGVLALDGMHTTPPVLAGYEGIQYRMKSGVRVLPKSALLNDTAGFTMPPSAIVSAKAAA